MIFIRTVSVNPSVRGCVAAYVLAELCLTFLLAQDDRLTDTEDIHCIACSKYASIACINRSFLSPHGGLFILTIRLCQQSSLY